MISWAATKETAQQDSGFSCSRALLSGQHCLTAVGFRFGILAPQAAKTGILGYTCSSESWGRRGPGHKGRVSRGPSSAPSPILGQPDRTKIRCSWPVSLCSGGYRITQEPSCESCAPEPSRATPAPSSCKCAHFAPVCCSKHPPAPGNSHVGPEPLTWVKTCAVRSDPPSGHPHILGQVISQPECDRCPKTSQSLSTAHR